MKIEAILAPYELARAGKRVDWTIVGSVSLWVKSCLALLEYFEEYNLNPSR